MKNSIYTLQEIGFIPGYKNYEISITINFSLLQFTCTLKCLEEKITIASRVYSTLSCAAFSRLRGRVRNRLVLIYNYS